MLKAEPVKSIPSSVVDNRKLEKNRNRGGKRSLTRQRVWSDINLGRDERNQYWRGRSYSSETWAYSKYLGDTVYFEKKSLFERSDTVASGQPKSIYQSHPSKLKHSSRDDLWRSQAAFDDNVIKPRQVRGRREPNVLGPTKFSSDGCIESKEKRDDKWVTFTSNKSGKRRNIDSPQSFILSYEYLAELSRRESHEIVLEVTRKESPFEAYFAKQQLDFDWLLLLMRILRRLCLSDFGGSLSDLLHRLCNSRFLTTLSKYLGEVYMEMNEETVKNLPTFVADLCQFYSSLLNTLPLVAVNQDLRKIIVETKISVDNINCYLGVQVDGMVVEKLEMLVDKFDDCKRVIQEQGTSLKCWTKRSIADRVADGSPQENFRCLNVYPTVEEMARTELGFVRPNKIKGAYESVEDYLDVQFRLLREDFVHSLRNGVQKYIASNADPSEKARKFVFDNVRLYPDTCFVRWSRSKCHEVGILLNFDPNSKLRSVNWEQSKRFMYGSLLLLSVNDFKTFVCATVLERDIKSLKLGQVLIAIPENAKVEKNFFASPLMMAESELFFEPYFLILKLFKTLDNRTFPMREYIVEGRSDHQYPHRLNKFGRHSSISVRNSDSWPTASELGLDQQQYEAFVAGLTRKFCIIQGPPGTGKTYLSLKIVNFMLKNADFRAELKLPILVICFTNHALDQFLEGMLSFTKKIVRVGGQSRSEKLKDYNLRVLGNIRNYRYEAFETRKIISDLSVQIKNMNEKKKYVETPLGILSTRLLISVVHQNYTHLLKDDETLQEWLLEESEYAEPLEYDLIDFSHLYEEDDHYAVNDEFRESVSIETDHKDGVVNENNFFDAKIVSRRFDIAKHYSMTVENLENKIKRCERDYESFVEKENNGTFLRDGYDRSSIYFEKKNLQNKIKRLIRHVYKLKANLQRPMKNQELVKNLMNENPDRLLSKWRWLIYRSWLSDFRKKLTEELEEAEMRRRIKVLQYEDLKMLDDLSTMKDSDVVGMTTTGAARRHLLLKSLQPAIVIVEEAAEVLEAHIVASLSPACQQVVLIGDHKQLRPSAAVYELSKNYNIDVSLFERMVNNGMHCPTLSVQHRMRPEISRLITPLVYPNLMNHESVLQFELVKGVSKNVFFVEHSILEEKTKDDQTSKQNRHEAEFVVMLAKYFIQQGYDPKQITILTFYQGQMFLINELKKRSQLLNNVECVVVDKYQGEENEIILLSLVRSNTNGKIGFLNIENRACVALSRARNGFFMIGNMDCLSKTNKFWQNIKRTLTEDNAIGKQLSLYCCRHDKTTFVASAKDFEFVREGGCNSVCNLSLKCDHLCQRQCHPLDQEHMNTICKEVVLKLLPCHHIVVCKCHQKSRTLCAKLCEKRMDCGHACSRLCAGQDDPYHDPTHYCEEPCLKYYENCKRAHVCQKLCYKKCGKCPMKEIVNLPCGHTFSSRCSSSLKSVKCNRSCEKVCSNCKLKCRKLCWEKCYPCTNKVEKIIPECGHKVTINCSDEAVPEVCQQKCRLNAPCGHKCQSMCGKPCDSEKCTVLVKSTALKPVCGHEYIYVLCSEQKYVGIKQPEDFLNNCQEPCNAILECGDVCSGTCNQCFQGRLHLPCQKYCGRTFVCGHRCKFRCQELCSPCDEPCTFRCIHSSCPELCGLPCFTCKRPCEWKCQHSRCTRKCGDICNRQPCSKPCQLKLPCGHDCIGFCGEPCPPQCRICNSEICNIVYGDEDSPNARFVLLVDCNHVIESKALERYLSSDFIDGKIIPRGCPLCRSPITKTLRCIKSLSDFSRLYNQEISSRFKHNLILRQDKLLTMIYFFEVSQVLISHNYEFKIRNDPYGIDDFRVKVTCYLEKLFSCLNQTNFRIDRQLMLDLNLELCRYHTIVDYCNIRDSCLRVLHTIDADVSKIFIMIERKLFNFARFTEVEAAKIVLLFKRLRVHPKIRSVSWPKDKLMVRKKLPTIFDDLVADR